MVISDIYKMIYFAILINTDKSWAVINVHRYIIKASLVKESVCQKKKKNKNLKKKQNSVDGGN